MLHLPSNFENLVLLAERADQALNTTQKARQQAPHVDIHGAQSYNFGKDFNGYQNSQNFHKSAQNSSAQGGDMQQSSQYNDWRHKGPAPAVLGQAQNVICYKCGQPGHTKRFCGKNIDQNKLGQSSTNVNLLAN